MFKKVLLISVIVILLIAGGLTAYVANMDWNSYRTDIADRFSKTMGKKIEFSGNISVSLWPKPHLSAKNVNILNPSTSEKIATVKNIEASLSLRALLEGTPEIENLSLNGTEIWYIIDENGTSNWRQQKKGMFLDTNIEFNRQVISIQNSWVHYQNRQYEIGAELSQVNADIVAESLVGPYRIDGNFVYNNDNYGFAVGLGDISQTDDIFLNFAVTNPHSNSYILYDGNYNMATGAFKGNFSGEFQLLATLVNSVSAQEILPDMFNVPFVFSVVLDANSQMLSMNSLALKYAEALEGSGNIKVPFAVKEGEKPTIEVQYQFLNLDARFLMMFGQMAWNVLSENNMYYNPQTDFNVKFDLLMHRMAMSDEADGAIENVSAKGVWADNELNIDEFYAACPGNIVWTMNGSLLQDNNEPNLFLKTRIEGKNIGAFARALGYPLSAPSQAAYRNVDINFNLAADPQEILLSDLKAMFDKAAWEGTFKADFSSARPKYELVAEVSDFNVDNYVTAPESTLSLTETIKQYLNYLAVLQKADIAADLTIDKVIFKSIPIDEVAIKMTTKEDALNVEKFIIKDVLGTQVTTDASIQGLENAEPYFAEFNYSLVTNNISPLINKLSLVLPQWSIFKDKPMQATGTIKGNLQEAEIDTSTTLKNTIFNYKGKIAQKDTFEFDGFGELKSTGFSELVNNLGGHWEKLKNNSAINCRGYLQGKPQDWSFNEAQCVLGTAKYDGHLNLRKDQNLSYISGKIAATEFDLANVIDVQNFKTTAEKNLVYVDDFMTRPVFNRDIYNFDVYRKIVMDIDFSAAQLLFGNKMLQNVGTHIKNEQSIMNLENLEFMYQQAKYAGKIQIDYTKEPKLQAQISGQNIKLDNIGGKIYKLVSDSAQAAFNIESSAVSAEEMIKNLTGTVTFEINDLGVDGIDLPAIEKDLQERIYSKGLFQMVRDNLQRNHTDFKQCKGNIKIQDGIWLFSDTICENDTVTVNVEGQDDINSWQINNNLLVKFTNLSNLPPLQFTFSGMLNKPTLDVNVEEISKQYDAHWEQVKQEEQAKQDAIQQDLNSQMDKAQENIDALSEQISQLSSLLEKYQNATTEQEYVAWYQQKIDYLQSVDGKIEEMKMIARQADWQLDDVEKINQQCTKYTQDLDKIKTELQIKYKQDLNKQTKTMQEEVRRIKDNNSEIYSVYLTQVEEKFSQIIRYDATQNPANDKDLQDWQEKMTQARDAFWNISYQVSDAFMQVYALDAAEDLRKALDGLRPQVEEMKMKTEQMKATRDAIFALLDKKIEVLQKVEAEKKEQQQAIEEEKRRLNQDNLLIETEDVAQTEQNSSPVVITEKAIDNNPVSPEAEKTQQPTLRAVDESVVLGGARGTISQAYEKQPIKSKPNPPSGLLRTIETNNELEQVSGTIISR